MGRRPGVPLAHVAQRGEPVVTASPEPDFEGHVGRECGEHRTTGVRAWCFDCTQWCYPWQPCSGCELPQLRATVERLQSRITTATDALHLIDLCGCTTFTGPRCLDSTSGRKRGAECGADAWCDACVARDALNRMAEVSQS